MRITLSGDLGSGKSSVGRLLAARLNAPHFSAGTLFREIGQISNLDALNTNLAAENNAAIDHAVDGRTLELDKLHESFVIDSRMAWHFVTNAIKVYLSASPVTAAERIVSDKSRSTEAYESVAAAIVALDQRRESEVKRYKKLYGVDISDIGNYDIVIVTDDARVEEVTDLILQFANGATRQKRWLPKTRLVPMVRLHAQHMTDAAATVSAIGDVSDLALVMAGNFGFFFDEPAVLAKALRSSHPFVPFAPRGRQDPPGDEDPISFARRSLDPALLREWEKAFGQNFSFAKLLAN